MQSDPGLVELIVRNLVSNAIRYTNAGGLLVTCRRRGNHALVEVRDTGIGIAPDQHQAVFQEFHQLANPERDSRKGLGLGLAIADGLARVLGTSLRLKSALGRGSTFSLCLPLAPASSASTARDSTQGAAVARQLATSHRLLGLRVLLIDDDALVRTAMQQLLVSWGCECNAAESIEQALLSIDMFAPQVLVCDYRLREQRSGAQAIAAVRAKLGCAVPSIIVTGDTAPDRLREALAVGVPLLHKPLSPHQLRTALQQVIAQA